MVGLNGGGKQIEPTLVPWRTCDDRGSTRGAPAASPDVPAPAPDDETSAEFDELGWPTMQHEPRPKVARRTTDCPAVEPPGGWWKVGGGGPFDDNTILVVAASSLPCRYACPAERPTK